MIYALETLVKSCTSWNEQQKNQVLAWLDCAKDFGSDNDVLTKENEQLKKDNKELREKVHFWKKEVNVARRSVADEMDSLRASIQGYKDNLDKAKSIISQLLKDIEIAENEYKFTSQTAIKAEQYLKRGR